MHSELETLINNLLSKGELTERSRELLMKKAEQLGVDAIDFELELEGRIAENKAKTDALSPSAKSNKEGDLKKCPSCGAPVSSFNTICSDCGHEFRNTQAASSIQKLYDEIQKIEESERSRERSWAQKIDGDMGIQKSIAARQASAISAFPVPNTREDLLEFLSIASSEAKKKLSLFIMNAHPDAILKQAWQTKCEQVITKARLSMKDDKRTLEEVESYAKQLKIR
jgi:hypothetical protein